jgi:oxygen-independent coproporphyrinogen-3 oxidase
MISPHEAGTPSAVPTAALDLDLIRKYAVPGPRYTSYPPANKFAEDKGTLDISGSLAADNADPTRPLSLYFHLPFCESRCWYCGCTTIITRRKDWAFDYLKDLSAEVELYLPHLNRERPVNQLHFGGGTPTFFEPDALRRLGELIHGKFNFTPDAELSVEIDPRCATREHVQALRDLGINRASLGIQDTNPVVQHAIHRIQPHTMNRDVVWELREAGIQSINLDLIYGLPMQTPDSVERTLDDVMQLKPDRLSVFSYAHVPWIKPAQRIFDQRGQMPPPEAKLAMFDRMRSRLLAEGYVDIGLDHFARPDDELAVALREGTLQRNFQGYSTRPGASLYSFGISSISATPTSYRQNFKSLVDYRHMLAKGELPIERGYRLNDEDLRRRRIIMDIMCTRGLDFAALSRAFGCDFTATYADELVGLRQMENDGLVRVDGDHLTVLPAGEPLLRVIAMAFDETLDPAVRAHALSV